MAIRTSQAINGFIAADPRLTFNEDGQARLYARVGINHFERQESGSFHKLEPTYHDLVQFGKGAERSYDRFRRGDDFVALGYVREYTREVDGEERTDEQFVARRLGHDPNTTTYEVQRRSRAADRESADRTTPDASREPSDVDSPAPARAPAAVAEQNNPQAGAAEPVGPPPPPPSAQAATR